MLAGKRSDPAVKHGQGQGSAQPTESRETMLAYASAEHSYGSISDGFLRLRRVAVFCVLDSKPLAILSVHVGMLT